MPHLNPDWFYLSGAGLPSLSWETDGSGIHSAFLLDRKSLE